MPAPDDKYTQLTKRQKAALLLLTLDPEVASLLMKDLSQPEVEQLVLEISSLDGVHSSAIEKIAAEFIDALSASNILIQGGLDEAKKLVERSLGAPKATEVLDRIHKITSGKGFDRLKQADSRRLGQFLQEEHPQTIALVLSNVQPEKVADVLNEFSQELRNDVSMRMATLGPVSPALLAEMEKVVEAIAAGEVGQESKTINGTKSVATVLNSCDAEAAKGILEHIQQKNATLATEIKKLMFVFEDLVRIDDRRIQRVLREVDKKDLAMSLKMVDETLKAKIYANMSERARDLIKEELQYMGPVRLKEVDAAQERIIGIVKELEERGEVVISGKGGKEEVLV